MYKKEKTVIVYLAMNTKRDESYGRDSASMLVKSLDSLYENYNQKFKHDIIIFYDNSHPFHTEDQERIAKGRKEIRFQLLDGILWSPPDCAELRNNPHIREWVAPRFSMGYRNMMRWYGILIYQFLSDLGYEMYMRMDDDSLIHSQIDYDMFKFMHDNNYEYGFRCYANDHISVSNGLIEFCREYMENKNLSGCWLDRFINQKSIWKSPSYNILGYYNNFLISKLDFWMRDDVQDFLKHLDNSGYMYTRRWNDLISQAVTIQMFMNRRNIYQFTDWTYEHATFVNYNSQDTLEWGGIYPKIENGRYVLNEYCETWYKKYGMLANNAFQTLNCRDLLTTRRISLDSIDGDLGFCLGKSHNIEEVHCEINDYLLNCMDGINSFRQFSYKDPEGFIWLDGDSFGDKSNNLYVTKKPITMYEFNDTHKNVATGLILEKNIVINPRSYNIK